MLEVCAHVCAGMCVCTHTSWIFMCQPHPTHTVLPRQGPPCMPVFAMCMWERMWEKEAGKTSVLRRIAKNLSLERQVKIFQSLGYSLNTPDYISS